MLRASTLRLYICVTGLYFIHTISNMTNLVYILKKLKLCRTSFSKTVMLLKKQHLKILISKLARVAILQFYFQCSIYGKFEN